MHFNIKIYIRFINSRPKTLHFNRLYDCFYEFRKVSVKNNDTSKAGNLNNSSRKNKLTVFIINKSIA